MLFQRTDYPQEGLERGTVATLEATVDYVLTKMPRPIAIELMEHLDENLAGDTPRHLALLAAAQDMMAAGLDGQSLEQHRRTNGGLHRSVARVGSLSESERELSPQGVE